MIFSSKSIKKSVSHANVEDLNSGKTIEFLVAVSLTNTGKKIPVCLLVDATGTWDVDKLM